MTSAQSRRSQLTRPLTALWASTALGGKYALVPVCPRFFCGTRPDRRHFDSPICPPVHQMHITHTTPRDVRWQPRRSQLTRRLIVLCSSTALGGKYALAAVPNGSNLFQFSHKEHVCMQQRWPALPLSPLATHTSEPRVAGGRWHGTRESRVALNRSAAVRSHCPHVQ